MRMTIFTMAVPVLAAFAFAQDTPPAQPPAQPKQPAESAAPATPASPAQDQKSATPADSTTAQKPATAEAKAKSGAEGPEKLPEMKTQTYAGTLLDASCAGTGSTAAAGSPAPPAPASSADRTAGNPGSPSCAVSATTSQFALKLKDGNTVRFDDVGNARAQEALKIHKKWTESAAGGKPLQVKASGVLTGDKLTVLYVK
jgi:hypothetical protein